MNRDIIKQIIIDHREYWQNNEMITRQYDIEKNVNYCFVGIRRTGKSYLMYQHIQMNVNSGIDSSKVIYVNFEDERILEMTAADFNTLLEVSMEIAGGDKALFYLDEIQNVDGWEKFVRRLADMKFRVCITGSNSKMLSSEISTTLGGRFMIINVYPYNFPEYLTANGMIIDDVESLSTKDKAAVNGLYQTYLSYGAFPELVNVRNKRSFLNNIYQTIYLGDIIARNRLENTFAARIILKKIAESVMKPVSYSRLTNIVKSAGLSIGKQTVINYVEYMMDAYLIFSMKNYVAKLVEKETSPKYYFMDSGLLGLLVLNADTAQFENLVAIELIRRYGADNVFYFESNTEVDFYVPEEKLAIQVSYSITASDSTFERETGALIKLKKYIPDAKCLIITNSEEDSLNINGIGIEVLPAWKWLT